jgi:hypothetical protein
VSVAGESVLWVDPAEVPSADDVARLGRTLGARTACTDGVRRFTADGHSHAAMEPVARRRFEPELDVLRAARGAPLRAAGKDRVGRRTLV